MTFDKNKKNLFFISLAVLAVAILCFLPQPQVLFNSTLNKLGIGKPSTEQSTQPDDSKKSANKVKSVSKPLLSLKSADGRTVTLDGFKDKVIFLNFWAIWCPPCLAEMPSINALSNQLKNKNIEFVMVDVDGNIGNSTKFMKKKKYTLPVYIPVGEIDHTLFTENLPTTIIIDKKGKIVLKQEGAADYSSDKIVDLLKKLAAE